jgi:hypothetical protein
MIRHYDILVEEPSTEAFLEGLLPRMLGDVASYSIFQYQCKNKLLAELPRRFAGYASYLPADTKIIVLADRDDDDCRGLKRRIEGMARSAGLVTRNGPMSNDWQVAVRIAIEELEAWYFGGWDAVISAYPRVKPTIPLKAGYRDPDAIAGGTWEAFERVLKQYGYFKSGLRKIEVARELGLRLGFERSLSNSFRIFRDLLLEVG